ncbi:unnamed protein product [Pseudo-nitzschia multistriata]|uniref:Immune mapped protein 2 N-terminal domain-containing protein n=1 Tax=Pseudo-nitzschia multistriata TaxID=183589 RepID=A0A448ZCB0_9STRA|nr:unnamed protein product [Pseudo-nitzschia multistriata]
MRIYNGGTFTNSYRSDAMENRKLKIAPSQKLPCSSFLPATSKRSIVLPEDQENSAPNKNFEASSNARVPKKPLSMDQENSSNFSNTSVTAAPMVPSKALSEKPAMQKGLSERTLGEPIPEGGVCNLVYEPDSSGRLVEHFTKTELHGMAVVGRWTAGNGKKIAGFKFKRNAGRNVLIGNCAAGVLGRKNYCNGFCQFVKQAYLMNGEVTLYDIPKGFKAMPVDVYLYYDDNRPGHQTVKLVPGKSLSTENLLAVSCLPKNTPFYETETVDLFKWLHDAEVQGYSSKC